MSTKCRIIPSVPFVGLYGSHSSPWRAECIRQLDVQGVAWFDPTDERWDDISFESGAQNRPLIAELVKNEIEALRQAACVVLHFAAALGPDDRRSGKDLPVSPSLASRFELGLLAGLGTPTFLHVEAQVLGRDYLWAAANLHENIIDCKSLDQAVQSAISIVGAAQ